MATTASAVSPEKVLRDLANLWVSLGKQETSGVLRACAMTLIVAVENMEDALAVNSTLGELMHEHPSRAIVLRLDTGSKDLIESRVFAQCWMPFGRRQQICCETIEITVSPDSFPHVPPVVLGITVPDLPVVLWCRGAGMLELKEFDQILSLTHKVIVNSANLGRAREAFETIAGLAHSRRYVGDLSWTRLTRWREAITYAADRPDMLARLCEVSLIVIRYSGGTPPSSALYLAAWFLDALGWTSQLDRVRFDRCEGDGDPIRGVRLEGPGTGCEVKLADEDAAEVDTLGQKSRLALSDLSDYTLLREELLILERDPVFERVFPLAHELARRMD